MVLFLSDRKESGVCSDDEPDRLGFLGRQRADLVESQAALADA